jgi:hypothetical protein
VDTSGILAQVGFAGNLAFGTLVAAQVRSIAE